MRRLRAQTYTQERKDYPWRLSKRLHSRVTNAGERAAISTTAYVLAVLKRSARAALDTARLAEYQDGRRGEERVTVTLRMTPGAYADVLKAATRAGVSVNRYICFVVHESLSTRQLDG